MEQITLFYHYSLGSKSSIESISIYDGTAIPIFASITLGPKSSNSPSYFSYNSPCVVGIDGDNVTSVSPEAIASKSTAGSTGVNVTSKPWSSNTMVAICEIKFSASQEMVAKSIGEIGRAHV